MWPMGLAFGFILGLVLGAPWLAPSILPWGVDALFLLSAFLLRLADRRWHRRKGLGGWISHMRMMPSRLLPWVAVAVVAFIAEVPGVSATGIILAAALSELLLYPLLSGVIGNAGRGVMMVAIVGIVGLLPIAGGETLRCTGAFGLGALLCAFWLRGPDGEPRDAAIALFGLTAFAATACAFPGTMGWSIISAIGCAALALAHLSTLRPRIAHWRPQGPVRFGRSRSEATNGG